MRLRSVNDLPEAAPLSVARDGIQTLSNGPRVRISCTTGSPSSPSPSQHESCNRKAECGCLVCHQLEIHVSSTSSFLTLYALLKMTASIDFGVKNKFQQVGKFANTEFVNNKDRLYI